MTDPDQKPKNARIKHALLSSSTMPYGTGGAPLGGLSSMLRSAPHNHDEDFEDEDDTTNPRSGHGHGCGCC